MHTDMKNMKNIFAQAVAAMTWTPTNIVVESVSTHTVLTP